MPALPVAQCCFLVLRGYSFVMDLTLSVVKTDITRENKTDMFLFRECWRSY